MSPSIGEQLRAARESRRLSLEDAFKATRIRVPYLQALENDNLDALPSKVHARGFLRLYASYLEITPEITDSNEIISTPPQEEKQAPVVEAEEPVELQPQEPVVVLVEEEKQENQQPGIDQNGTSSEPTYFAIYREIGEKLRKQREKISLSLEDISLHTRLKLDFLELIENGQMDLLPSPVQARGMISNYSEFLNLDTESLLVRFADALQIKRLESLPPPPETAGQDLSEKKENITTGILLSLKKMLPLQAIRRIMTPDLLIGGGLILVLLILVIWGALQVFTPASPEMTPTAPSISQMLMITGTINPVETSGIESSTPVPGSEEDLPAIEIPLPETTLEVNTGSQPIQVYVIANQRTLLRVKVDGSEKINERILPGNAYQFSGYSRIELLTGNGSAIRVIYNQTDLGILGETGEVVNLVFTRTEVSTATPSQKPTATRTPVPTLTLKPSPTPTVTLYVP